MIYVDYKPWCVHPLATINNTISLRTGTTSRRNGKRYRLTTVLQTMDSSKDTYQGAGRAEHEGEREGDGEEDVLIGDVGVDPAVVEHEQGRGHRYSRHENGRDTQRFQGS